MWLKFYFSFICLILGGGILYGQTNHRFRIENHAGFIISHSKDLKPVSDNLPVGITLGWQMMNTGKGHWDVCNCFYYLGAQFSFHDFGDVDVLGRAYTFSGSFEPVLYRSGEWSFNLNSGMGVTYLTNIYHPENNPLNNFFSTHLSFLLFVAPVIEYNVSSKWSVRLSLNYNHISNGGQKQPNRGMNFPQLGLGMAYSVNRPDFPEYEVQQPELGWRFWGESGFTTHKVDDGDRRKPSVSIVLGANRTVSVLSAFGSGVEYNRDFSIQDEENYSGQDILAPFISHHFILGRFDFSQRMNYYVISPANYSDKLFYQRYVLLFNAVSDLSFGISLKAHGHVATNLDFRVGWNF